jgi:hypothetical protein
LYISSNQTDIIPSKSRKKNEEKLNLPSIVSSKISSIVTSTNEITNRDKVQRNQETEVLHIPSFVPFNNVNELLIPPFFKVKLEDRDFETTIYKRLATEPGFRFKDATLFYINTIKIKISIEVIIENYAIWITTIENNNNDEFQNLIEYTLNRYRHEEKFSQKDMEIILNIKTNKAQRLCKEYFSNNCT